MPYNQPHQGEVEVKIFAIEVVDIMVKEVSISGTKSRELSGYYLYKLYSNLWPF